MKKKQLFGILILIGGIVLVLLSMYIKNEVAEGRLKISRAQKQVDQSKGLFNLSPYTKPIGKGLTGAAQKQIDEGRQEANEYANLANLLQIGGVVLIIAGGVVILMSRKKRS